MGDAQKFYDYELWSTTTNSKIEDGSFEILIDDYVAEAMQYKYCIICNALKPLGSRLIDGQSQKMTAAASAMADRKTFGQRS